MPSASMTIGFSISDISACTAFLVSSAVPSPGPISTASALEHAAAIDGTSSGDSTSPLRHLTMYAGECAAMGMKLLLGVITVTRSVPARSEDSAAMMGATLSEASEWQTSSLES